MYRIFLKEIVLCYMLASIIIILPNVNPTYIFYIKSTWYLLLSVIFFSIILTKSKGKFFTQRSGLFLLVSFISTLIYGVLTLTFLNFLIFSIWFILLFSFFGNFIKTNNLKLGLLTTITLIIVDSLLLRVVLSKYIPSFNFIYTINDMFLSLTNTGYNVGRTGWGASLVLFICFLKTYKLNLAGNSKLKKLIINISIILAATCIVFSDSRTSIVALGALLVLWNYQFFEKRTKSMLTIVIFMMIELVLLGFIFLKSGVIDYFILNTRLSTFSSDEDISNGRFKGIKIGIDIIKDNAIIGTYPIKSYDLQNYGLTYPEIHLVWLNLMALYGIPLITILFLCISVYTIRALKMLLIKYYTNNATDNKTLIFLILFGVFNTFVEPNSVVSFISYGSLYWFSIGSIFQKC